MMIREADGTVSFVCTERDINTQQDENVYRGMSRNDLMHMADEMKSWEPDTLKLLLPLLESIEDDMQRLNLMIIFYRCLHELGPENRTNIMREYVRSA